MVLALKVHSVSQLNWHIRELLEADETLQDLWVEGEVSNFVRSAAGHIYFTLKDSDSQVRCVMFRGQMAGGAYLPDNGEKVVVHGVVSVYEVRGEYQVRADFIRPAGVGELQLQFELLKKRLQEEGLLDESRKRALPAYPQRIGVVSSPTGAVIHDIINVVGRRYPLAELLLSPTLVQGAPAADNICAALRALNECPDVDVIILARGGGSLEELWPFNEEKVARAIYASRVPVVSGVGHETDVTIADLVADVRAPTPSAAAELVVPDGRQCRADVEECARGLADGIRYRLESCRNSVAEHVQTLERVSPATTIARKRQQVEGLCAGLAADFAHWLQMKRERLKSREMQLESLSPYAVLQRGYSLCWHVFTRRLVKSVGDVADADPVEVQVADGSFWARVHNPGTRRKRRGT